jgi:hypothetical protein
LTSLLPELICLILTQLDCAGIHAVTQTSSYIYRAFTASRDFKLREVARKSLVPEVLVEAVTAVKLRNMECGFGEVEQNSIEIYALARESILSGADTQALLHDFMSSADILGLHQLQSAVEYFVHAYCNRTPPLWPDASNAAACHLSWTELARLQRAICRYDICQTLSHHPGYRHDRWECRVEICDPSLLLVDASPWEIEEVACIWQFMHKQLDNIFDKLEDALLESIVARSYTDPSGDMIHSIPNPQTQDEVALRHPFDLGRENFIFSTCGRIFQTEHIAFLASRTLPFLQTLFESDTDRQRRLILKYQQNELDHLGNFLEDRGPRTRPIISALIFSRPVVSFEGDKLSARNLAWLRVAQIRGTEYFGLPCNYNLRDWGYVFWDECNLRLSMVADECKSMGKQFSYPPRRQCMAEPSGEQKLKSMKLLLGRTWFQC